VASSSATLSARARWKVRAHGIDPERLQPPVETCRPGATIQDIGYRLAAFVVKIPIKGQPAIVSVRGTEMHRSPIKSHRDKMDKTGAHENRLLSRPLSYKL